MVSKIRPYGVVIALIMGFAQAASASELTPKVVVTMGPIKAYVDSILKGIASSQNILRPGQDPHSAALTPSQAQALDEADILIVPDMGMNASLAKLVATKPKLRVIELSKLPGSNTLPYAEENPWVAAVKEKGGEADEEEHEHHDIASPMKPQLGKKVFVTDKEPKPKTEAPTPSIDPHFWLDPERMAALATPLANAIGEFSQGNRAVLRDNAANVSQHLREEVLPGMRALIHVPQTSGPVGSKPLIPFITYHAAYQYFLGRFGLTHTGEITARPEEYLGAKTLASLLTKAKKVQITCIIGENESPITKRIATESGAKIIILSPEQNVDERDIAPLSWIQGDYDRLLYKTAKTFGDCVNPQKF